MAVKDRCSLLLGRTTVAPGTITELVSQEYSPTSLWEDVLPARLQKLVGEFPLIFHREFVGKFGGNFAGFLRTHKIKAQTFRENFGAFFVRKFVAQNKDFVPKFALQTCHVKKMDP